MKKILLVTIAIAVIAAVIIGVFIATFDINTYKAALISQLQAITGCRVEIGRLSLAWKGRIVLGIEGFRMYAAEDGKEISILSFEAAEAGLELMPLVQRKFNVSSISIDSPQIYLVRSKDGKITFGGYHKKAIFAATKAIGAPAALVVNVRFIGIRGGTIRFVDLMGEEPADITIKRLDADIRNVSLAGPVNFDMKMALASDRQDLAVSGTAGGFLTGKTFLKDFQMEADLAAFGHADIIKALPAIGKTGLKEGLAGVIKAKVRKLQMADGKVSELSGDLIITGGRLVLSQVRVPIEDIELDATAEGTSVTLKSFAGRLVNGVLKGTATIDDFFASPRTTFRLAAEAQGFHKFLTEVAAVKQNLDGNARISLSGTMEGAAWPEMSRTLVGKGEISLDNGMIINANVLGQTVGALTVFPNLVNSLQGSVAAPAKQALVDSYTVLKPLNQSFTIEGGYIMVPDLILQSEYADMRGNAKMSFTGDLSGSGMIRFAAPISGAMLMAVPQMKAITDAEGLVTFPIAFKGGSGTFKVIPDTKYIGKRIAIEAAGDVVSGFLKKATEGNGAAQEGAAQALNSTKPPKIKDVLKALAEELEKKN